MFVFNTVFIFNISSLNFKFNFSMATAMRCSKELMSGRGCRAA